MTLLLRLLAWLRSLFRKQIFASIKFTADNQSIVLSSNKRGAIMTTTVTVGHIINCSIQYLDQNGQPMLTTPTPDSPPKWSNTAPTVETLTSSLDGTTCQATAKAAGADSIGLAVLVGGKSFTAALDVTVVPPPQVLTSIAIVPKVV